MKNKVYRPYIATLLLFVGLYTVLDIFSSAFPYLHLVDYALQGKMALHPLRVDLFTYGLVLFLLAVNVWQVLASPKDDPSPRIYASLATVVLIYVLSSMVYFVIHWKAPNNYSFPAGPTGLLLGSATVVLLAVGLLVLDLVKWMVAKLYGSIGKRARHDS
ncbi:MAG: hypothetical protein ICV83_05310 [Cytophagales bacterium]|nr:hypothetical protein [Cytophagales bacterium]